MTAASNPESRPTPCVATIGFFDGVHAGHRFLIDQVKREATVRGLESALITFATHPRHIVHPDFNPELLTTTDEKIALLKQSGADRCIILPFNAEMSRLTAREFMLQLKELYNVRCLLIGHDHRFGKDRKADFNDYREYGLELGIDVKRALAFSYEGLSVSSSSIRAQLAEGDITSANRCLGYEYCFRGNVVEGHQVGRTIGYPTANIEVEDSRKLIPANGVYAVRVTLPDGTSHPGMLNIGHRPTIDNGSERTIEVNILHFNGDIYGQTLSVSFLSRLRGETRFGSIEELSAQLSRDAEAVEKIY